LKKLEDIFKIAVNSAKAIIPNQPYHFQQVNNEGVAKEYIQLHLNSLKKATANNV
jgi:hypothetical protein